MTEAMLDKKLAQTFAWWDQNEDGSITEDDAESIAKLFAGLADVNDEENRRLMREGLDTWWGVLLDGREDKSQQKITKEDWFRTMKAVVLVPNKFEFTTGKVIDGTIGALDRNKDGVLSLDEYLGMYERLKFPKYIGIEAFKRLDRDGNGVIDHAEFHQAMNEFFIGTDANAPGHWLLGPPEGYQ